MDEITSQGNISQFKPRPKPEPVDNTRYVFVCGECNCRTFNLMGDGSIECSYCDKPLRENEGQASQWRRCVPLIPTDRKTIPDEDANAVNVHQLGDVDFARNSVFKNIEKWVKKDRAVVIGAYHVDGSSSWWFGVETDEQRRWCISKMREIIKHLKGMTLDMPMVVGFKDESSDG